MKTFLAPNEFISNSGAHVPEAPESAAAIACPQPRAAAAPVSDGVGAKPILAFMPSEAATVSGREPVAATNPVAKATKGKSGTAEVTGLVRRSTAGTGLRVGEASADLPATSEIMDVTGRRDVHLSHNKITQAVEIQSSCGGVEGHARQCGPADRVNASNVDVNPMTDAPLGAGNAQEAGIKPGPQDQIHDLEQLIGVAGKRRRRPLALPRFVPNEDAIEAAARDPSSPRALETDPVWADPPPLFLSNVR